MFRVTYNGAKGVGWKYKYGQFARKIVEDKMPTRPTKGRIVHYKVSVKDREEWERRFVPASSIPFNSPFPGDVLPMIITDVDILEPAHWVSGTLFLNNGHTMWLGSITEGDGSLNGYWFWPPLV